MTRRPLLQDQNVLIPSIGESKCRASHFWSHDLVGLMLWSLAFVDQNNAKATAAGSECFDPQHWGNKVSRNALLIPWSCRSHGLISTIQESKWREGHCCGVRMNRAAAFGDRNYAMCKTTGWCWFLISDSVELIWKPICLNCEFVPIPQMYILLLRYMNFNYVGIRLETNGWAIMRTQYKFLRG
jgi:hypothetical protein